jgi:uncharacterized membrane protein YccC
MAATLALTAAGERHQSEAAAPIGSAENPTLVALVFAFKAFAAGILALFLAFWLGLDEPKWTLLTVFIVAQPESGLVLAKGFYRILGTIGGVLMTIAFVFAFSQSGELFLAALAVWLGFCNFAARATRNFASYGFLVAGYTVAIVGIPAATNPDQAFQLVLARFTEIVLAIACAALVSRLVFPRNLVPKLVALVHALARRAQRIAAAATGPEWQLVAGERRQFVTDFTAAEAMRASAYFESTEARILDGALRQAADAALDLSAAAERTAGRASSRSYPGDEAPASLDILLRDLPDTPRANGAVVRRLVCGADMRDLADAAVRLRKAEAALDSGAPVDGRYAGRGLWSDPVDAALTGVRSALAVAITSALWIATAWPSGPIAVIIAAMLCSLLGGMEQPVKVSFGLIATLLIAALPVFATIFALLPLTTDFLSMAVALAPLLLACGVLIARTPAGVFVVSYFTVGSSIDNVMTYDLAGFINSSIAILTGMGIAMAIFAVFFPETPQQIGRRFQRQLFTRLGRACGATPPSAQLDERAIYERLAATVARLKNEPAAARACIAAAITALSTLRAVDGLRTAGRLSPAMTCGIAGLLAQASLTFLRPSRASLTQSPWEARALRRRALALARTAGQHEDIEPLAAVLVECERLRRNLIKTGVLLQEASHVG